ncbi:FHA domain-containing protein [Synechococcus sp. RSCCF101]|uniref:transglycosylase domain-containing protein n=1 Tax=Synechococcus sp. RSCCF101 TaxID=2511069 RepID=UPI001245572B|nr:transglycosylase domain-containing protein [Synechococcus sp. RSCCF101]QEY33356.1 FHA domain-containing protein [Synechococcus sp. RSCCF101]
MTGTGFAGEDPRWDLHGHHYRIGRESGLEIRLDHPSVSRRHAVLQRLGRAWLLQDAGSTNGLWWRGRRVRELWLRDGDRVAFAPAEDPSAPVLVFHQAPSPFRRLPGAVSGALLAIALAGVSALTAGLLTTPVSRQLAGARGPLLLFDRTDQPLASPESEGGGDQRRLEDGSERLVRALLASEDDRFWWHPGLDPIGTTRALLTNISGGRVLEGGSTLTQQLARSLYPEQVGRSDTLSRKWRELLVALQLEARFSKETLLLAYLNRVYLGVGWGFDQAAQHYFGRPSAALSLEQAALLVGLLPSPNGHDPCRHPERALEARNRVLQKMADSGRLSHEAARQARRRPVELDAGACRPRQGLRQAPFYTDQVRRDLADLLGPAVADEGNFLIETHLDPSVQSAVEQQLERLLARAEGLGVSEGAVVVLDYRNGGILALAGGRDYRLSQFNRATMALRQPGSTFKLMPYLVALGEGLSPADGVDCSPLTWAGQTFGSSCSGRLSLRAAFAVSSNTAALRLARQVGLDQVLRQARDLGISTPLSPVPGLVLGQSEVTLLELTAAYAAVANDGVWHQPTTIRRLLDVEACPAGTVASCRESPERASLSLAAPRPVLRPDVARRMQELLRGVVRTGTGRAASLGGQEGGKTGTTNDSRDLLFVGYDPARHWAMGIWLGNDDNSPTRSSSALAASLWASIMREAGRPGAAAD